MERCEWDPDHNQPAEGLEQNGVWVEYHGCPNEATILVGRYRQGGNWHLCESCAALPAFARLKKQPLRRARDLST